MLGFLCLLSSGEFVTEDSVTVRKHRLGYHSRTMKNKSLLVKAIVL